AAFTCDYFFLLPFHSLSVSATDLPLLVLFLLVSLFINVLNERLQAKIKFTVKQKDDLATLNAMTAAIGASLDLATVLHTLTQGLRERLRIPGGLLLLPDENGARFTLAEVWGFPVRELPVARASTLQGAFSALDTPKQGQLPPFALPNDALAKAL